MLTRHHHLLGTQGHTQHKEDRTITSWQFPRSEGLKPLLSWVSNTTANQATGVTAVEEGVLRQETQEHHYMFLETESLLTGSNLSTPISSLSPLGAALETLTQLRTCSGPCLGPGCMENTCPI